MPVEGGMGARGGATGAMSPAVAASVGGANSLTSSAAAEAESLLECLSELVPIFEETLVIASEVNLLGGR